ncbi:response regulator [Paenibacillus sp. 1P07SE]|uniref:response regulator n=1 Tax=Paenibacillus sp. 1P07SE TaxID=3132209 RepID=UPI0039A4C7D8
MNISSLRTRMILLILIVTLIPLTIVGIANYLSAREVAEAPVHHLLWRTVFFIMLAELAIFGLILMLFNRLIARISSILQVTEQVAEGQFDVSPLPVGRGDEIDQLAGSVNGMIEHLREMFEKLETIINQNGFAFIVMDQNYKVTYFSKAAERMLGYTAEEVLYRATPLTFIAPDEVQAVAAELSVKLGREIKPDLTVFRELRQQNLSYTREWTFVHKDGTRIPIEHFSNGLRDRNGGFAGSIGIARDITELKHAEKARNRLLEVMEAAKDLVATIDAQGRLIYMNPAGLSLLELTEEEATLGEVADHPLLFSPLHEGLEQARAQGYWETESSYVRSDGHVVYASQIVVVHHREEAGEMFYSIIARDITGQKLAQAESEQSKREAEEASKAKSRFLARMSHEIRTPLNGVIGLTQLMKKTELSGLQRQYLDNISLSSQTLLGLINDVLDVSRIEAGKLVLEEAPFDPGMMLMRLCDAMSLYLGHKQELEFLVESPAELPASLIGDCQRIEQILLNLCSNAVKFTPNGRVELGMTISEVREGMREVTFIVEDTGIGIAPEQLDRLFEHFTQADGTASRKYGGSGLGLVIVKSLVEQMGGTLQVWSEPGVGSRFSFALRLRQSADGGMGRTMLPQAEHRRARVVWVVEDDERMRTHWCEMLEEMGVRPMPFASWSKALSALQAGGRPALLLLDMEMHDMYGEETWLAMHDAAASAGARTMMVTTVYGREEVQHLPEHSRPDALLVKPVSRLGLYQGLQALLERPGEPVAASTSRAVDRHSGKVPQKARVLLAEDNRINQLVAVDMLRSRGFEVGVAENGMQALELVRAESWDLVLLDIHMPEMDGTEVARRIRLDSASSALPIIALTANVLSRDHQHYLALGMNAVITKPIDEEQLFAVIDRWLPQLVVSVQAEPQQGAATGRSAAAVADGEAFCYEEALARLNGKETILQHMLQLFDREYADYGVRLGVALQAGDDQLAYRLVHTLKGVAGSLSARRLMALCAGLEEKLRLARPDRAELTSGLRLLEDEIAQVRMQMKKS